MVRNIINACKKKFFRKKNPTNKKLIKELSNTPPPQKVQVRKGSGGSNYFPPDFGNGVF